MNKTLAAVLEFFAAIAFSVSLLIIVLTIGYIVVVVVPGHAFGHGWVGWLAAGLVLALASAAVGGCSMTVLDKQSIEHEGVIAAVGQMGEDKCAVTFADGYVCELDFVLGIGSGAYLTVWRNGRDELKRLEIKPS